MYRDVSISIDHISAIKTKVRNGYRNRSISIEIDQNISKYIEMYQYSFISIDHILADRRGKGIDRHQSKNIGIFTYNFPISIKGEGRRDGGGLKKFKKQ